MVDLRKVQACALLSWIRCQNWLRLLDTQLLAAKEAMYQGVVDARDEEMNETVTVQTGVKNGAFAQAEKQRDELLGAANETGQQMVAVCAAELKEVEEDIDGIMGGNAINLLRRTWS